MAAVLIDTRANVVVKNPAGGAHLGGDIGIEGSETDWWHAARWVFDAVVEAAIKRGGFTPELYAELETSLRGLRYVSIPPDRVADIANFVDVAADLLDRSQRGLVPIEPTFLPGFINKLTELIQVLEPFARPSSRS